MKASFERSAVSWSVMAVLVIVATLGMFSRAVFSQEEERQEGRPQATNTHNQDAKILKKLDQVVANQEAILHRFDEVMEELRIIKIRASLNR